MNFTREPIIETIISPREGHKLLVRNSKGGTGEEYFVDAVEVVSFGHAFFFRSLERPKSFVVPASDYEILEVKETRVALKNVSHERSIKIGGGKEASMRQTQREAPPQKESEPMVAEEVAASSVEETALESAVGSRMDKRRDKRRHRRRRGGEDQDWSSKKGNEPPTQPIHSEPSEAVQSEPTDSIPLFSALIPPPSQLISQTLSRYKEKEALEEKPEVLPEELKIKDEQVELFSTETTEEKAPEEQKKEHQNPEDNTSESSSIHRMATSHFVSGPEAPPSTLLKSFSGNSDFYFF